MSRLIPPASALGLACVVVLSACGAGSGATGATSASTTSPTSAAGNGQGGAGQGGAGQGRFPGVNGLVAAVDGQTLQVQGNGMQTAVIFTSATKFTAERPAKRSDVTVGSCVMVGNGSSGQSAASTPATPPTTEVAASVSITPAVAGSCTSGRAAFGGGPGGGFPGRTGGTQPTGQRTGGTGRPGGVRGGAFGQVTAVTATGFDVKSTLPNGAGAATATATPSTRVVHVTTTASTTYTRTGAATSAAAAVGTCVTATGTSDQTGALQARAINVRPAVDGTCSVGFGRQAGATTNG